MYFLHFGSGLVFVNTLNQIPINYVSLTHCLKVPHSAIGEWSALRGQVEQTLKINALASHLCIAQGYRGL